MAPQITTQQHVFFAVAMLLQLMAAQGESQRCAPSTIDVLEVNTGKKAVVGTVFQVTVTNRCRCAVKAVFLRADGFARIIPVDPKLFRLAGHAGYLVGDGRRIESGKSVTFQYGWTHYFKMTLASVQAQC